MNTFISDNLKRTGLVILACFFFTNVFSQIVDYSVVSVDEESGRQFTRVTKDTDNICMPLVHRGRKTINWLTNRIIDVSPDGQSIAFVANSVEGTNIFVKELDNPGEAVQRTNRKSVLDFSYSPDGKFFVFCETGINNNIIFQTDVEKGFICRQISNGGFDLSPVYSSSSQDKLYFARAESNSSNIWSYDISKQVYFSYTKGLNPSPTADPDVVLFIKVNESGKGEIWRINCKNGIEECILSDPNKSFSTPSISPDAEWIVFVGSTPIRYDNSFYWNTDIYACKTDGSLLTQLTYHAADDISPVWSPCGKYIYFISQRGSRNAAANIWKMNFIINPN